MKQKSKDSNELAIRFFGVCYLLDESRPFLGLASGWIGTLSQGYIGWDDHGFVFRLLTIASVLGAIAVGACSFFLKGRTFEVLAVGEAVVTVTYYSFIAISFGARIEFSFIVGILLTRALMIVALWKRRRSSAHSLVGAR